MKNVATIRTLTTFTVFRELGEFIFCECESDAQAALLATIAAGQDHVLTLLPAGNALLHRVSLPSVSAGL
jgi:hypothetical protein